MIGLARKIFFQKTNIKIPSINEVKQDWNNFSHEYSTFDFGPQTFYYTFNTMMEMNKAENILQVACGTGKLLPFMLKLKSPNASYWATDISPNMIELAKNNLQKDFKRYESRLSFEQWCQKQNLNFALQNAEQPLQMDRPFDRIICNCALMITEDARKMLKNLHKHAKPGCLLGVNVWGNKNNNNLMLAIRDAILESGFQLPQERSNFHLYRKVPSLAEETGWEVVVGWEQNAPFPVLNYHPSKNTELFHYQINKLPENQREKVKQLLDKKVTRIFENKDLLNFSVEMFILRKKQ